MNGLAFSRVMFQNHSVPVVVLQPPVKPAPEALSRDSPLSQRSTADDHEEEQQQIDHEPRALQLSYERLAQIASHAATRIDWNQLRHSTSLWDEKKRVSSSSKFSIYTRQSRGMHYVMAVGTMSCTLSELRSILRPTTETKYTAAMHQLYGESFIDGAILHRSRANSNASALAESSSRASVMTAAGAASRRRSSSGGDIEFMAKTATFAKPHVFARNQQWSFLECFQCQEPQPGQDGFIVTMSSLSPFFEVPESNDPDAAPVDQLQGITAVYSVVTNPHDKNGALRVTFYSKFAEDCTSSSALKRHGFKLMLKAHLMQMARATTRLPMIVRRRRLEVFSMNENTKAFTLSNPLCICCTTTLHFLKQKRRCHSCGYFVCEKCSIEQEVEAAVDQQQSQSPVYVARVCQPCIRRLDEAIYERISAELPLPPPPPPRAPTSSMAEMLDHIFHTGPETKRQAVMSVINNLLEDEERNSPKKAASPTRSVVTDDESFTLTDPKSEKECLRALQTHLSDNHLQTKQPDDLPVQGDDETCDFTNSSGRNSYIVPYQSCAAETRSHRKDSWDSVLSLVAGSNSKSEAHRSKTVRKHRLTELEDVSELEIICAIACRELKCAVAMITVAESDMMHVVATNSEIYRNVVVPREESFCAYTILNDTPLVVAQPEIDPRFRHFAMVQRGLRFYAGFPLQALDGTIVGTLCCGDSAPRELSQLQMDAMVNLATTASKIMQLRGKDICKKL
ncbi:putative Gaf domaincontaining protein, partial [Globisporangium splendens]